VKLTLDDWDRLGREIDLVNLLPSGKFLMETSTTRAACRSSSANRQVPA
jgi:hypothetical protein